MLWDGVYFCFLWIWDTYVVATLGRRHGHVTWFFQLIGWTDLFTMEFVCFLLNRLLFHNKNSDAVSIVFKAETQKCFFLVWKNCIFLYFISVAWLWSLLKSFHIQMLRNSTLALLYRWLSLVCRWLSLIISSVISSPVISTPDISSVISCIHLVHGATTDLPVLFFCYTLKTDFLVLCFI